MERQGVPGIQPAHGWEGVKGSGSAPIRPGFGGETPNARKRSLHKCALRSFLLAARDGSTGESFSLVERVNFG
jgi:hypothetical protein